MNETPITYSNLFAFLVSVGFQEKPPREVPTEPRIFFHKETDTILAFCRSADESVTPADLMSTEVHLHAKGIMHESLQFLVGTVPIKT